MNSIINIFQLKKEAHLFDSKIYILKAFLAIIAAYGVTLVFPPIQKDTISVLFGLVLSLEPVTITGIRSGLNQIYSTFLGALLTAVIILLLGINVFTIALSVSATLFLCLKIDWKAVSPVAIFTAIYMTQYVQLNASGDPSVMLTFKLRILALGVGVTIAIVFNYIFSLFSYRNLERKRIVFIANSLSEHLKQLATGVENNDLTIILQEKEKLPTTFNGIDWLLSLLGDKQKEAIFKEKLHIKSNLIELKNYQEIASCLRNITHLIFDTAYVFVTNESVMPLIIKPTFYENMNLLAKELSKLGVNENQNHIGKLNFGIDYEDRNDVIRFRLEQNLVNISEQMDKICTSFGCANP